MGESEDGKQSLKDVLESLRGNRQWDDFCDRLGRPHQKELWDLLCSLTEHGEHDTGEIVLELDKAKSSLHQIGNGVPQSLPIPLQCWAGNQSLCDCAREKGNSAALALCLAWWNLCQTISSLPKVLEDSPILGAAPSQLHLLDCSGEYFAQLCRDRLSLNWSPEDVVQLTKERISRAWDEDKLFSEIFSLYAQVFHYENFRSRVSKLVLALLCDANARAIFRWFTLNPRVFLSLRKYCQVRLSGGDDGWIFARLLRINPSTEDLQQISAGNDIVLRAVMKKIEQGTILPYLKNTN